MGDDSPSALVVCSGLVDSLPRRPLHRPPRRRLILRPLHDRVGHTGDKKRRPPVLPSVLGELEIAALSGHPDDHGTNAGPRIHPPGKEQTVCEDSSRHTRASEPV
jgi:hypothetical protein